MVCAACLVMYLSSYGVFSWTFTSSLNGYIVLFSLEYRVTSSLNAYIIFSLEYGVKKYLMKYISLSGPLEQSTQLFFVLNPLWPSNTI